MILDVNVLLYAIDRTSPHHEPVRAWLARALSGTSRVGIPWQTAGGFLRVSTHPRVFDRPLTTEQAWTVLDGWLASPVAWVPASGVRTVSILREIMCASQMSGPRTTDAQLAAIAMEHGVPVVSTDADFARIPGLRWIDPR